MGEPGSSAPRRPDALDEHIGMRLRLRRSILGLSPSELGDMLGMSLEHVEAIEDGRIRVAVGDLFELSRALEVPVSWFYEHLAVDKPTPPSTTNSPDDQPQTPDEMAELQAKLLECLHDLPPRMRRRLVEIAQVLVRNSTT